MRIIFKIFLLVLIFILFFLNWERVWNFLKNLWNSYILPFLKFTLEQILAFLKNVWQKIELSLRKRVEETKKIIEGMKLKEEVQKIEKNITDKVKDKLRELLRPSQ